MALFTASHPMALGKICTGREMSLALRETGRGGDRSLLQGELIQTRGQADSEQILP